MLLQHLSFQAKTSTSLIIFNLKESHFYLLLTNNHLLNKNFTCEKQVLGANLFSSGLGFRLLDSFLIQTENFIEAHHYLSSLRIFHSTVLLYCVNLESSWLL